MDVLGQKEKKYDTTNPVGPDGAPAITATRSLAALALPDPGQGPWEKPLKLLNLDLL
jgi:hypothetical protein